jgi:uncharacterized membrane protein YkvA (DUF1232 family)
MMRIVLELSDNDLKYFRKCLRRVRDSGSTGDEAAVLGGARSLLTEVVRVEAPDFVRDRFRRLELLIRMLEDGEWRLTGADRARVLEVLTYFTDPDDLIPDRVPGIGYLDDAIMVELACQELRHEIEAYEKFCAFRESGRRKPEDIAKQRLALQGRMRRSRRRDREKRRARSGGRSPIGLW